MGEAGSHFQPTPWSLVFSAQTEDLSRRKLLLENLTRAYWKPVYSYIAKKGYSADAAKDMTQSFFCEIILGRDLIRSADRTKGRFRTLLLVALERHVASTLRRDGRLKRGGQTSFVPLDAMDLPSFKAVDSIASPEQAFYYTWVTQLLDKVLTEVRNEYCGSDRTPHWETFRLRVVEPILDGAPAPPLSDVCTKLGIDSASQASNMIETVKRRFRAVLKRTLRDLVRSDEEAEEEFNEIFTYLSRSGAR